MKRTIRLSERGLHRVIKESVRRVIREALDTGDYPTGNYDFIPLNSFEDARQFARYTTWSICKEPRMFDIYSKDSGVMFVVCAREGFESMRPEPNGYPTDEYGTSLLCVGIDVDTYRVDSVTGRYNHENGGNDNIMSETELIDTVGRGFYDAVRNEGSIFNHDNGEIDSRMGESRIRRAVRESIRKTINRRRY